MNQKKIKKLNQIINRVQVDNDIQKALNLYYGNPKRKRKDK